MPSKIVRPASFERTHCDCGGRAAMVSTPVDGGFVVRVECTECGKHTRTYDGDESQKAADDWSTETYDV